MNDLTKLVLNYRNKRMICGSMTLFDALYILNNHNRETQLPDSFFNALSCATSSIAEFDRLRVTYFVDTLKSKQLGVEIADHTELDDGRNREIVGYTLNRLRKFMPLFQYTLYGFEVGKTHHLILEKVDGVTLKEFVSLNDVSDIDKIKVLIIILGAFDFGMQTAGFVYNNMDSIIVCHRPGTAVPILMIDTNTPIIVNTDAKATMVETHIVTDYVPILTDFRKSRIQVDAQTVVYTNDQHSDVISLLKFFKKHATGSVCNILLSLDDVSARACIDEINKRINVLVPEKITTCTPTSAKLATTLEITSVPELLLMMRETGTFQEDAWKMKNGFIYTFFRYKGIKYDMYADLKNIIATAQDTEEAAELACRFKV